MVIRVELQGLRLGRLWDLRLSFGFGSSETRASIHKAVRSGRQEVVLRCCPRQFGCE